MKLIIPTDKQIKVWCHYMATIIGCNYVPIDKYDNHVFVSRHMHDVVNKFEPLGIQEFLTNKSPQIEGTKYDEWVWKFFSN